MLRITKKLMKTSNPISKFATYQIDLKTIKQIKGGADTIILEDLAVGLFDRD